MNQEMTKVRKIDASQLKELILAASDWVDKNKEILNRLNVFPVPDGDTGINMSLTLKGAVKALKNVQLDFSQTTQLIARASLMEARGCSGNILSQWLKGFSEACQGKEYLSVKDLGLAFEKGAQSAYRAVEKPVEGTILTVMREVAKKISQLAKKENDLGKIFSEALKQAQKTLAETPELLPVLKEAGVVDAGGQGFVFILEAITAYLNKKPKTLLKVVSEATLLPKFLRELRYKTEELVNKYCFESVISTSESKFEEIKEKLKQYGSSLITSKSGNLFKIHIHTNYPKKIHQLLSGLGKIKSEKIDDMEKMIRRRATLAKKDKEKKIGIVAVTLGSGLTRIFKNLGADVVITGRYVMNPSVRDLDKAIKKTKAEEVIILPNNENVLVTAKEIEKLSGFKVYIVSSKTIPQGISALLSFNSHNNLEQNLMAMNQALKRVKSGLVTYSLEERSFQQSILKKGDKLGFCEEKLEVAGEDLNEVTIKLIEKMVEKDSHLLSLYYGKMVTKKEAERLAKIIKSKYPDLEVQIYSGGQPHYFYIISCE